MNSSNFPNTIRFIQILVGGAPLNTRLPAALLSDQGSKAILVRSTYTTFKVITQRHIIIIIIIIIINFAIFKHGTISQYMKYDYYLPQKNGNPEKK